MKNKMIGAEAVEECFNNIADGTDFEFSVSEETETEIEFYMQGDNPCREDWCEIITVSKADNMKDIVENLQQEVWERYDNFDIEEETYLMLEAKRNGFRGVPGIVDLVHNEEYKKNALEEFAHKIRRMIDAFS